MCESKETYYCRLCAERTPREQLISTEDEVAVTSKLITKMLWINIDMRGLSALPNTVCVSCFDQLEKTYMFLHNARTAQRTLTTIFAKRSNRRVVDCTVQNKDVIAENVAKPVDEDWESFQITKHEVKSENQIDTVPESSIVNNFLFKYDINVVKQEIHSDNDTPLGERNIADTEGFTTTNCYLPSRTEVLDLEQTDLHNVRTVQHNMTAIFSKKSNHGNHTIENNNVEENIVKPVNKDWELCQVVKQEAKDENQIETDHKSSIVECNSNTMKQEIACDSTPLGECNMDIEGFNTKDTNLALHNEVLDLEHIVVSNGRTTQHKLTTKYLKESNHKIMGHTIDKKNVTKPHNEDWESVQVIKMEIDYENQIESLPESSSTGDSKSDNDMTLGECNIIDTKCFKTKKGLSIKNNKTKEKTKLKPSKLNIGELAVPSIKTWDNYACSCADCDIQCKNIASLRQHSLEIHTYCCAFKCSHCGTVIPNYKLFISHSRHHRNILRSYCEFCDKKFTTSNLTKSKKKHFNSVHKNDYLTMCPNCGMVFETLDQLQDHMFKYSKTYKKHNNEEPQEFQSDLKSNNKEPKSLSSLQHNKLANTKGSKNWICHLCSNIFLSEDILVTHMRTHEDTETYTCESCRKTFRTEDELQCHISSHSKVKSFVCEQCRKSFRFKRNLKIHSTSFVCEHCNKSFCSKTRFNSHLRKHTKPRFFNCIYCLQDFRTKGNLKKHMIRRHNVDIINNI